jgi:hypothetical protein
MTSAEHWAIRDDLTMHDQLLGRPHISADPLIGYGREEVTHVGDTTGDTDHPARRDADDVPADRCRRA